MAVDAPARLIHDAAAAVGGATAGFGGLTSWLTSTILNLLIGLVVGLALVPLVARTLPPVVALFRRS